MPRFRFSLLALLVFVTLVAVGCAALVNPTRSWLAIVQGLVYGLLVTAAAIGAYGKPNRRAFWFGFAVAGWGYLYVANADSYSKFLPTEAATQKLLRAITSDYPDLMFKVARDRWHSIQVIAEWLWSMPLGFIGGLVARHLYLRRERQATSKPPSS